MTAGKESRSAEETRSSWTTELRYGKRNGDEAGLKRAQKSNDVVKSLRGEYRCPITRATHTVLVPRQRPAPAGDLRPRQAFSKACRVQLVVDEGERYGIGPLARVFP